MKKLLTNKQLTIKRMVPNLITLFCLCIGLTGMRMAIEQKWEWALLAIILSMILDFMDGLTARLLNATSTMGMQLDSLSDLVAFGVAPAFILYRFALHSTSRLGWGGVMFYTACMALRLARFNTMAYDDSAKAPLWFKKYSVGVPAPAGAGLILTPIFLYLATDWYVFHSFYLNLAILLITGTLLISRIPTLVFKNFQLQKQYMPFYAMSFILFIAILSTHLWITLGALGICYMISIPISYRMCFKTSIK